MFAGHAGDFDRGRFAGLATRIRHIDHHIIEEVKIVDVGEVFSLSLASETGFGVRGGDYG
jgi:hypothetical protein